MKITKILSGLLGFLLILFIAYSIFGLFAYNRLHGEAIGAYDKGRFKELRDGDIIFQTSKSSQSKAIQLATNSRYSHMGIIYKNAEEYYVYEAVQPVKLTPLAEWIDRGDGDHFVVKRLKNAKEILTSSALVEMKNVGERFLGKAYDIYFEWSDNRIYCSELVWKIYQEALGVEVGEPEQLSDFDLSHSAVKAKMKERYGDEVPLQAKVISPAAMFESENLITIMKTK